ncbi:MAG: glycosyltransferase family 2 protein [Chitinophagaceae bacterium]|nr:glycosyltransferase family 2 protein [Chitinophagaceae bacterium]
MNKIAIIIITYNRPADMLALAMNIEKLSSKKELLEEVIIVNNNSTESYDEVKSFIQGNPSTPFKFIESKENLGVSRGRNFAIEQTTAPILVLIDDDAEFQDLDVLERINTSVNENPNAGILAMKILYFQNKEFQINCFPHKSFEKRKNLHTFDTYYFAGCGNIIVKEAFDKAGSFPTDFFYGMEEYDLSYRVLDAGYTIKYIADIVLLHKESPEGRQTKSDKLKGMWVNKTKVAWRYLPLSCYLTTAIMWSLFFLLKSKFDLIGFIKGWAAVISIPFIEKRMIVTKSTIEYLNKVEARIIY